MYRFSPKFALRHAALTASAAAIVCLSGCAGISGTAVPSSLTTTIPAGSVHGGQQPILGAHVYLMAANLTGGYGSASTSLLHAGDPGTATDTVGTYVTTGVNGDFNYGGTTATCTPGTQVYLLATGGNPTGLVGGAVNGAIVLTAALGDCATIGSTTFTSINEVTTAAMASTLQQFMVDGTHLGTTATNATGLVNAFKTIANLVDPTTGTALATTPAGNGIAPQATLNTLANIIAPCVNSGSGASSTCQALYSATTPTGSSVPTNVFTAALNIGAFPAANVNNLYTQAAATAPFQPALTTQPNDFTLGITYSPVATTITQPGPVVVDGSGNVYFTSCQSCLTTPPATPIDTVVKFGPDGSFIGSYGAGVLHFLRGIALDSTSSNLYTLNQTTTLHPADELIAVSSTGTPGTPIANPHFGTNSVQGITFDQPGNIWITAVNGMYNPGGGNTQIGGTVIDMNTSGTEQTGSPFNQATYSASNLSAAGPAAVATDNSGNVWVLGSGNNSLLKFNGTGTAGTFTTKYTPTGFSTPLGLAINGGNELWITENNNTLSHIYGYNGANASGSPLAAVGLYQAQLLATDGAGQVLIPNCRLGCPGSGSTAPDNLLRLSVSGAPNTGGAGANYGAQIAGFDGPGAAASDASGNVWVTNSVNGTLTQVIGYAAPTIVPLSKATSTGSLGQLP
jgi:hypothetical protein